jgi:hypothetical protein
LTRQQIAGLQLRTEPAFDQRLQQTVAGALRGIRLRGPGPVTRAQAFGIQIDLDGEAEHLRRIVVL